MENLKEIAVIVVGVWAAVEVFKELLSYFSDYQDNWYRKQVHQLSETIEDLRSQLSKKGKR